MRKIEWKKKFLLILPYVVVALFCTNLGKCWRLASGNTIIRKIQSIIWDGVIGEVFTNGLISWHLSDMLVGAIFAFGLWIIVQMKGKEAKKYRRNEEYGSARWGTSEDIAPFIDPLFKNNVILSATELLTMNGRPSKPQYARNKNVLVVGGSGSGKTRFWLKPNLLQMHSSYLVTDPKGSVICECGMALLKNGYRIKVFNTINFKKTMHYNPFVYIHSEKDILKLVTVLIANTKGDGKGGDDFWIKAETLLYTALIGYIHYEAPEEEQNFITLLEMINAMEVREDDEEFKNPVDLMFEELEKEKPNHFAVRQYAKYKLAAGVIS